MRILNKALWLLLIIPLTANAGMQETYNKALQAHADKKFSQAFELFHELASQGESYSQKAICVMYEKGEGVSQDIKQAVSWCEKAANSGNGQAQVKMGSYYFNGKGVKKDTDKAEIWYRKAAKAGMSGGQAMLGVFYMNGISVNKSYLKAEQWFTKSAKQNNQSVFVPLAKALYQQQKYLEAEKWLLKSAAAYNVKAYNELGDVYNKLGIDKKALKWYAKAAEAGDAGAMGTIGAKYYLDGVLGFERNVQQARIWFTLAASKGSFTAEIFRDQYGAANISKQQLNSKMFLALQIKKLLHPGFIEIKKGEALDLQKEYAAAHKPFEMAKFYLEKGNAAKATNYFYEMGRVGIKLKNKNTVKVAIQELKKVVQQFHFKKAEKMAKKLKKLSKRL